MMSLSNFFYRILGPSSAQKNVAIQVNDVGTVLAQKGLLEEAIENFTCALNLDPTVPAFWSNLGNALHVAGNIDAACKCFEKGGKLKGAPAPLFDNWGAALFDTVKLEEAMCAHKKAIALDPNQPDALANLGSVYRAAGRLDDALMNMDAAIALDPDSRTIASSRLYTLSFLNDLSIEDLYIEHARWPGASQSPPDGHRNDSDPDRILRVGYVSSDFKTHSCANFLLPLIEHHDRTRVHVTAFSGVDKPDEITERFRGVCDGWVNVGSTSDRDFFSEVRGRAIDILIDCSGHTNGTKLSSFLLRPAPLQISWLGYPNTTGLAAMDFKLTDTVATPAEMQHAYSEKLLPLSDGFHTYRPVNGAADVSPPPCVANGYPTFGAFHNLAKISDAGLEQLSSVLRKVPNGRLLIKSKSFLDPAIRASFERRCVGFGIDRDRLETRPWRPLYEDHFADFADVDIALDATPYNGTTTTCEALWMGVPVVTLIGDKPAGRVSASLLTQIRHPEWIAEDNDDYVRIAAALASDPDRLVKIRQTLRRDIEISSLGNARMFAQSVEGAYRALWQEWCAKQVK